jgi:hypothetical protein
VAAALAVTAVTGAVGAGVLEHGIGGSGGAKSTVVAIAPAAAVTGSLPELLDDPTTVASPSTDGAAIVGPRSDGGGVSVAPLGEGLRADTPVVDVVGSDAADEKSKEQPVNQDAFDVFFGVDPHTVASDITGRAVGYTSSLHEPGVTP